MIDLHSHIIPEIDDGSRSISETMQLLKEAEEAGFDKVISTSHYIQNQFEFDEVSRMQFLEIIKNGAKDLGINVELYLGSEIYVTYEMAELVKQHKASTINNSKYVLFELPMKNEIPNFKNILYVLLGSGYLPIIAHPERYEYVKEDPNWLMQYLEIGVMFQANYGSIIGLYGKQAQKTVKKLLKNNMIHFLGSDVHRQETIYKRMPEILEELRKTIDEKTLKRLSTTNPGLVLENKPIYTEMPKRIKNSFWD